MQRAELALKLKEAVAAEAKKRQGARNDLKKNIPPKLAGSSETRHELAKMANISHGTLAKVAKISSRRPSWKQSDPLLFKDQRRFFMFFPARRK